MTMNEESQTTNAVKFFKAVEESNKIPINVNIRGLIVPSNVASLIGQRGSNLLHLTKKCGVLLTLSESLKKQRFRILTVNGQPKNCADAWTSYLDKCIRFEPNVPLSVDFIFPKVYIMFAEEEHLFEKVALESKAEIKISDDFLPNSTECLVKVSIKSKQYKESFYTAVKLIAAHAHQHPKIVMSYPGTEFYCKTDANEDDDLLQQLSESSFSITYNPLH